MTMYLYAYIWGAIFNTESSTWGLDGGVASVNVFLCFFGWGVPVSQMALNMLKTGFSLCYSLYFSLCYSLYFSLCYSLYFSLCYSLYFSLCYVLWCHWQPLTPHCRCCCNNTAGRQQTTHPALETESTRWPASFPDLMMSGSVHGHGQDRCTGSQVL